VIEAEALRLVVVFGQGAVDIDCTAMVATIEEETRANYRDLHPGTVRRGGSRYR
jgi:hypothetical protein